MLRLQHQHRLVLRVLPVVVLANYLAQIPYYLHVHYFPHGTPPSVSGTVLLGLTCVWFLLRYIGTAQGKRDGYWLLLTYLAAVVSFYAMNLLTQVTHGYAPFFHMQTRDPILFVVFGIGYLNLLVGIGYLYYLLRHRRALVTSG